MASIASSKNGHRRILFYDQDRNRKTVYLGKCSLAIAKKVQTRMESLLSAKLLGNPVPQDDATWLNNEGAFVRAKLESAGLLAPTVKPVEKPLPTVTQHFDDFIVRVGKTKKPGTITVWKQVRQNLLAFLPPDLTIGQVTRGHAKQFYEHLRGRKLAALTIQKQIRISRQVFEDAVDFELLQVNPFSRIRVSTNSTKSNVEVPRETIDRVLTRCDLTWKVIVALSRYGGLRTPSETLSIKWTDIDWENNRMAIPEPKVEHHDGRGVRSCPLFPELRAVLDEAWEAAPERAEYIVDKPAYRAAANTGEGWKNANLRTQFLKILKRAGVPPWRRVFHSMRASRQTELERMFPLHVVCAWLGNSPKIAQRSYLLVTEADFQKAANAQPEAAKETREVTSKTRGTKTTRADQKRSTKTTPHPTAAFTQEPAIFLGKEGWNHTFPMKSLVKSTDGEGFEPTDAFRRLRFSRPVQ